MISKISYEVSLLRYNTSQTIQYVSKTLVCSGLSNHFITVLVKGVANIMKYQNQISMVPDLDFDKQ